MALHLTENTFEKEVLNEKGYVLVDFWASWCMPCQQYGRILEANMEELEKHFKVCKVNVDDERDLAIKYGVMSIPTTIIFKDGKEFKTLIGVQSVDKLLNLVK